MPPFRLARRLSITSVSIVAAHEPGRGLSVSAELNAVYAEGYRGERTSFIRR